MENGKSNYWRENKNFPNIDSIKGCLSCTFDSGLTKIQTKHTTVTEYTHKDLKHKIHSPFKWIQLNGNVKIGWCILKILTIFTSSI